MSRRHLIVAMLALGIALVATTTAAAVHWPFFGGDAGRSGYQPVDEGGVPVTFVYQKADGVIQTSIITGAGIPSQQRMVYGTSNGNVHLQVLQTGAPVGSEAGIDIATGASTDTFTGNGGSVTPVDTSSASGLGQVYVVHNDDNQGGTSDIALAQIDPSNGALVKDVPLAGTDGYTVSSSPILSQSNAGGGRSLFFVASATGSTKLFKVAITNADAQASVIGTAQSIDVAGANPLASPTIVFLANAAGQATEYVAVAAGSQIRTFSAADLTPGPQSSNLGGTPQTPSVPVTTAGTTPGQGQNARPATAPSVFVAVDAGTSTIVHKLTPQGTTLAATSTSAPLAGDPAPALAVTQEVPATGSATGGRVVVTTSANLYVLSADNLSPAGTLSSTPLTGTAGFSRTTAAASGDFAYVARDNGQQLVIRLSNGQPVAANEFTQNTGNSTATYSVGQPSLSRGFVQFGSDRGAFVYRNRDLTPPTVRITQPETSDAVRGTITIEAVAFDARGIDAVAFQVDGKTVATVTVQQAQGNSFAEPGATFRISLDTRTLSRGTHTVRAVAKDLSGIQQASEPKVLRVDNPAPRPTTPVVGACGNRINGNALGNRLRGTARGDVIRGRGGNDVISGFAGSDCLYGDAGNDQVFGGASNDRVYGGAGNDRVYGGFGNDLVSGGSGADLVQGNQGNDRLFGYLGNDRLVGGPGADVLNGGPGNDTLFAKDGSRDVLKCGTGIDTVRVDRIDVVPRDCERVRR